MGSIDSLNIALSPESLRALNENLPSSGERWQPATISYKGSIYQADVKYRGFSYWHWSLDHKSWRIRLRGNHKIFGRTQFDLIRPKAHVPVIEPISNRIANSVGVLASRSEPVPLFVNHVYSGASVFIETLDQSFLSQRGLKNGSIVGIEQEIPRIHYRGRLISKAWIQPNYWLRVHQGNDTELLNQRLDRLAELIRAENPKDLKYSLEQILDIDKFASYYAFANIVGLIHQSSTNSIRMYLNPETSRFEPITWDHMMWFHYNSMQITETPIVNLWRQVPEFETLVQQKIWKFLNNPLSLSTTSNVVDEEIKKASTAFQLDAHRLRILYPWYNCHCLNPFLILPHTFEEFLESAEDGKRILSVRANFLKDYLTTAGLKIEFSENMTRLEVLPNVGLKIERIEIKTKTRNWTTWTPKQLPTFIYPQLQYAIHTRDMSPTGLFIGLGPAAIRANEYRLPTPKNMTAIRVTYSSLVTGKKEVVTARVNPS